MVKKWHYLAATNLSVLLQGKSSNHHEDFCLNCFNSYTTKNKLKEHEEIWNNHDSCHIEIPNWVEKNIKIQAWEKSLKAPFAIYLDWECLLKKEQFCQNNPEKSYTVKKDKHEPSGWAMFTKCSFDEKENNLDYCRKKDCIEKLCKKLKERTMKTIDYEKKKWYHWLMKKISLMKNKKHVIYVKKSFVWIKMVKIIKIKEGLQITTITQENLEELLIANAT